MCQAEEVRRCEHCFCVDIPATTASKLHVQCCMCGERRLSQGFTNTSAQVYVLTEGVAMTQAD